MPEKHLTEEQIALVAEALNDERFEQLSNTIREHIANCDECSTQAVEISEMQKQLEMENALKVKEEKKQKLAQIRLFVGAAAAIALIVASYFLFIKDNNFDNSNKHFAQDTTESVNIQNNENIAQLNDTTANDTNQIKVNNNNNVVAEKEHHIPETSKLLAYNENQQLEELYVRYNSANMRDNQAEILSDSIIKIKEGEKLTLKWKDYFGTAYIEIFDNQNKQLISQKTEESQFVYTKNLKKGLYYWKFIDSDFNLLYCGKIEVN